MAGGSPRVPEARRDPASACPICGAPGGRAVFREQGVDLLRCPDCRHVRSTWVPADLEAYWGDHDVPPYGPDHVEPYWYHARLPSYREFFRRFARRPGRLVDVGAGFGYFVRFAREQGWDAEGWEISPGAVEWSRRHVGTEGLHAGRVEDAGIPEKSVDVVTLWDVIEHLEDPGALVRWARGVLRPGGLLLLQTPNVDFQLVRARALRRLRGLGEDAKLMEARDHLNDFTFESMRRMLDAAGYARVDFHVMLPTFTVAGDRGRAGVAAKLGWYAIARALHAASGGRWNVSNSIHAIARV